MLAVAAVVIAAVAQSVLARLGDSQYGYRGNILDAVPERAEQLLGAAVLVEVLVVVVVVVVVVAWC